MRMRSLVVMTSLAQVLAMAGVVRATKVLSRPSAFDGAALDTVRAWRFDIPRTPAGAEAIYVYAIVGFREPITQ